MTAFTLFHQFLIDRGNGVHNMGSDTYKWLFTNTAPDKEVDTVAADIVEIAAGGGYPAGGLDATITGWTQTDGLAKWTSANLTFVPSGDVEAFQWAVLYDSDVAGGPLVGYIDRGSPLELHATGDPFKIYFSLVSALLLEKQSAGIPLTDDAGEPLYA